MILEKNETYECDIVLSGFFEKKASNERVSQKLVDAGFSNVVVWGDGEHRIAKGTWGGETQDVSLPEQVQNPRKA